MPDRAPNHPARRARRAAVIRTQRRSHRRGSKAFRSRFQFNVGVSVDELAELVSPTDITVLANH
jgi:hypothetical protein